MSLPFFDHSCAWVRRHWAYWSPRTAPRLPLQRSMTQASGGQWAMFGGGPPRHRDHPSGGPCSGTWRDFGFAANGCRSRPGARLSSRPTRLDRRRASHRGRAARPRRPWCTKPGTTGPGGFRRSARRRSPTPIDGFAGARPAGRGRPRSRRPSVEPFAAPRAISSACPRSSDLLPARFSPWDWSLAMTSSGFPVRQSTA